MEWYQYLTVFFAGAFFTNAVPHFVHGISFNYYTKMYRPYEDR